MKLIKEISKKQIIGLTTKIKTLDIPMLGNKFYRDLLDYPKISNNFCKNNDLWCDLNQSFIIFFLYPQTKKEIIDYNYGLGPKKVREINKALKQFDLSLSLNFDQSVIRNFIASLINKRDMINNRNSRLYPLKISELPRLRKDSEEEKLMKEFLDMHFETFQDIMRLGINRLRHLKKPKNLYFRLIRNTLENFLKKELR